LRRFQLPAFRKNNPYLRSFKGYSAELSATEYDVLLQLADPALHPICKTRYAIPYAGHTVEVDLYDFWQDRATAEVELADESEAVELPPYLCVIREVSDDKRYKNVNLARELPEN
jgi:CYTH domain-containing protein